MEILTYLINGAIGGFVTIKIGEKILNKKIELNNKKKISIILYSIVLTFNYIVVDNFLKVILILLANILLNNMVFGERIEKNIIISFIEYLNVLVSEIITVTILMIIFEFFLDVNIEIIKNTLVTNLIIMVVNYILANILKEKYKMVLKKTDENSIVPLVIMVVLILVCIGSLFYKIDSLSWKLNNSFLLNAIIIIIMSYIGIITIIQRLNYENIDKQYRDLAKYSETNSELLEEYSALNHEYKNQLIIIRGMLEDNEKEVYDYVKSLINKKSKIKFKWIKELNNISFQGLKSFMNYKILEMVNEGIKVNVTISKECKEYQLDKLATNDKDKIYSVVGVFLDNAREAAKESENKEVSLEAYICDAKIYIEIANTYNGEINLQKINNYGYTSKGNGHGTGLYMVNNIIKKANFLEHVTEIKNKYFIQKLIIKIKKH